MMSSWRSFSEMDSGQRTYRQQAARQRGSVYVLVLAVTTLVFVIGMAAAMQARIEVRQAGQTGDSGLAQVLAASAMEYAIFKVDEAVQVEIGGGAPWRDQFTDGLVVGPTIFGNGSFTYMLEDALGDGDLSDDPTEPVYVEVAATVGANVHRVRVRMSPGPASGAVPDPLDSLGYALWSAGKLDFETATASCDQIMGSNNKVQGASGAQVDSDIESFGKIQGGTYNGTLAQYVVPSKQMPNSTVFDYYIQNGTVINYSDLSSRGGSARWIWGDVLSPAKNPFGGGTTNPLGIYVIDCQGQEIAIAESRIVGTLVILNPGLSSRIEGPLNWEPAISTYPALLVQGDMTFRMSDTRLDEGTTVWGLGSLVAYNLRNPNFNPPGTPWQGATDIDRGDDYVSAIAGLVYVSGIINIEAGSYGNVTTIEGVVLGGNEVNVRPGATFNLLYKDVFFNDPPPGFIAVSAPGAGTGPMQIVEGSWEQVVD